MKKKGRKSPQRTEDIYSPPYYTTGSVEPIDVIEDWGLEFHLANVIKYIARCHHKGSMKEDLLKAKYYLDRFILMYKDVMEDLT